MNKHLASSRRRSSIRLRGFDYARAGAYFVTICAHQRENLFGEVVEGELHWSPLGEIVLTVWAALPSHYPRVHLDSFVLMPNHLHGILWLQEVPAQPEPGASSKVPSHQLSEIVRGLKALTTRRARERGYPSASPVWQRGYHERIVRSEGELMRIREYIDQNPARWAEDRENVGATRGRNRNPPLHHDLPQENADVGADFKSALGPNITTDGRKRGGIEIRPYTTTFRKKTQM